MNTKKKNPFLSAALGSAGLVIALSSPATAQNPFELDMQKAFERQIEQFSRLLPDNPDAKEQFNKGLEEMRKAFEEDAPPPSAGDEPKRFEFHWEGDSGDLGDLRMEFERMGGKSGSDFFEHFFGGRNHQQQMPFRFPGGPGLRIPHGFEIPNWFDMEKPEPPENSKNHADELRKFRSVVKNARASTVQLLSGGNQVALGTIVSGDGYALTKRSELGGRSNLFEARLADGNTVSARFIESIDDYDLALIKLDAENLQPATFADADDLPLGTFLAAPDITENPAAVGVLSVLERNLSPKSKGYLGIAMGPAKRGVAVESVVADSAAAAAGIRPSDVIVEIDGIALRSPRQMKEVISNRAPDEMIEINYIRNGREATTSAKLRSREDLAKLGYREFNFDQTSQLGARVNRQRGGYPSAVQHDIPLSSNQMGGPVVDLDGRIVALNIARAGRVSCYALPASEVNEILAALKLNERETLPSNEDRLPLVEKNDTHALREEMDRAEQAIEEARRQLRAAEERQKALLESLEKQHP